MSRMAIWKKIAKNQGLVSKVPCHTKDNSWVYLKNHSCSPVTRYTLVYTEQQAPETGFSGLTSYCL